MEAKDKFFYLVNIYCTIGLLSGISWFLPKTDQNRKIMYVLGWSAIIVSVLVGSYLIVHWSEIAH